MSKQKSLFFVLFEVRESLENNKKDILFLCQFFYPEYNSSASLPYDTAKYLANNGFSVGALCGYPKEYNAYGEAPKKETVDNIEIKRLKYIQLNRKKKIGRFVNYFSFTFSVLLHIFQFRKYKSVIVYSNPPILPIAAILANIFFGTKIVFVSFDVYPEVAYASDSLSEKGFISKFMRFLNHNLFKRVSQVVALTEEMKEFLLENRPELNPNMLTIIPNWAHEDKARKTKEAFSDFGFSENDFIVSYFGNMGVCQDVETLYMAMSTLKNEKRIKFLVVGHGSKLPYMRDATKDLKNVQVYDFQIGEKFEYALAVSSCGIVTLEKGLKGTCAPSKYYSYLQSGLPVIAVVEPDSYLVKDISENNIGYSVSVGDGESLVEIILNMSKHNDGLHTMSDNAENLYEEKYSINIGTEKYRQMFKRIFYL